MTHERIAGILGVRREGVSVAALKLQREGLIHYSRGRIQVLDRRRLEQHSCECYSVVERAYSQLRNGSSAWPHASAALDLGLAGNFGASNRDVPMRVAGQSAPQR